MTTRHLSIRLSYYSPDTWSWAVLETICEPGQPARSTNLEMHWGTREQAAKAAHIGVERLLEVTERDRVRIVGPGQ